MTNHYIRQGATGSNTGTDWTNAWTALPAALFRGDTYYIATGSYGSYTFDDPVSGTQYITIKKAISSDHGTDAGWQSSYGDGQTIFSGWTFNTNYLTIDGQVGGGPNSWNMGHGIAVRNLAAHLIYGNTILVSNITLLHIEIDGTSNEPADRDAVYLISGAKDLTMRYMYIHDIGCDIFQLRGNFTNFTLEYSKLSRNNSSASCHGDVFEYDNGTALNWIHRYNLFEDVEGTYLWGTHESGTFDGAQIYGNVIYRKSAGQFSNGMVSALSGGGTIQNIRFYNNTIYGLDINVAGFGYIRGSNNLVYNNIWYLNGASLNLDGVTHDYNWFYNAGNQNETHIQTGSSNPFINSINGDFHLLTPTNAGLTLPIPYNIDPDGNIRGADGIWDRGAFEYSENVTCPTPIVSFTMSLI